MPEHSFTLDATTKEERYEQFLTQYRAFAEGERYATALLANTAALLKEAFGFFWVGFYLVRGGRLVLGPFQGPVACSSIAYGHGVCGTAWRERKTIVVPDVDRFPGHIACSSSSRSEIVVPLVAPATDGTQVAGVLDVDSDRLNEFDDTDRIWMERIVAVLMQATEL